jgi:soluble lytic murein transglycosylase-like protein
MSNYIFNGLGGIKMKELIITLIFSVALEVGVDGNLAYQVALKENVKMNPVEVGVTGDLGIMQLNPRYVDYFVDKYWDKDWEFDWQEPYDNIYVGLNHLKYLLSIFCEWTAIVAYNAGEGNIERDTVPEISLQYAGHIYLRWKGRED